RLLEQLFQLGLLRLQLGADGLDVRRASGARGPEPRGEPRGQTGRRTYTFHSDMNALAIPETARNHGNGAATPVGSLTGLYTRVIAASSGPKCVPWRGRARLRITGPCARAQITGLWCMRPGRAAPASLIQPHLDPQHAAALRQPALVVDGRVADVVQRAEQLDARAAPSHAPRARELEVEARRAFELDVVAEVRVHAVLGALVAQRGAATQPHGQRHGEVEGGGELGLVLGSAAAAGVGVVDAHVLDGRFAGEPPAAPGHAAQQLDAGAADLVPVHTLEVAGRGGDADDRVHQPVMERDGLAVQRAALPRDAGFTRHEDFRLEVRVRLEAAEGAGVQLAQRGEARAPAHARVEQHGAVRRHARDADAATPRG